MFDICIMKKTRLMEAWCLIRHLLTYVDLGVLLSGRAQ